MVGAVAIELIHNFSLIHDDIIDGDTERRHRSTVWSEFGIGQAIIAGDALATLALQVLLDDPTAERVRAAGCLVEATQVMIAGQADDMAFESRPSVTVAECLDMERGKTSALLSCAVSLGAILAGAPDRDRRRARRIRLARRNGLSGGRRSARDLGRARHAPESRWGATSRSTRRRSRSPSHWPGPAKSLPELRSLLDGDLSPAEMERARALIEECGARDETVRWPTSTSTWPWPPSTGCHWCPGPRATSWRSPGS